MHFYEFVQAFLIVYYHYVTVHCQLLFAKKTVTNLAIHLH